MPTDAVSRLLAVLPDVRAHLIISLMLQEGLRRMEVAGLQIGDVDMHNRQLSVVGKGGHERVLPLSEQTAGLVARYLAEYPAANGPLIRSYRSPRRPLTPPFIGGLVREWMLEAGVKVAALDGVSAHALRHTCAQDMIRNSAHILDVQAALGHANLATTQRYLPAGTGRLREAMGGRTYLPAHPA